MAKNRNFRWSGPYAVHTYFLPDEIWEYWEDADLGMPYQLVKL